ncbi:MAG: arylsulfatase [Verrucomicrobiota bacterium]
MKAPYFLISLLLYPFLTGADEKTPNILLIVADDLGYSDLGCYGGEIETPNLDQLGRDGVRLTRFYNTGRCCPSRAAILTGQYPHRVGLGHMTQDIGRPGYRGSVSEDAVTIAQALAAKNYRSFLSGKWHLGTDDPTKHGFEEFYGTLVSAKTFWAPDHYLRLPADRKKREYDRKNFYGTDAVTDHALDFLDLARETPEQPWFLYLAYHAPHFPLQAPKEDIAKYADDYHVGWDALREMRLARMKVEGIVPEDTPLTPLSRWWNHGETKSGTNPEWFAVPRADRVDLARRMAIYAAMIDRMDRNIGRVLAELKAKGEFENTLIVFTSDNGACAEWDPYGFDIKSSNQNIRHEGEQLEQMGGPGTYHSVGSGWANASNTPWRLQKHFCHEGGIASPGIIHWPSGQLETEAIVDTPAHIIDLLPTFLAAAEANYEGTLPLPGTNLVPLLRGGEFAPRRLFFEHEGNRAVITNSWKLVALREEPWELYNTWEDRTELKNVAAEFPNITEGIARRWESWAEENLVTPLPNDYQVPYLRVSKPSAD